MTPAEELADLRDQIGWARTRRDYGQHRDRSGWQVEVTLLKGQIDRLVKKMQHVQPPPEARKEREEEA
jgi:hypothetical protein